jgi:hypothetical protein
MRASQEGSVYKEILMSTGGAIFLGTPFRGGHSGVVTAAELRIAIAMQMRAEVSNELVRYLNKDDNKELDELAQTFGDMVNKPHFKFPIMCFYETQETDFTSVIRHLSPKFRSQLGDDMRGLVSQRLSNSIVTNITSLSTRTRLALLAMIDLACL